MPSTEDTEVITTIRELSNDPRVCEVWTEISLNGHRIWMARGNDGHPWLLASDSLARFRVMISELSGQQRRPGSLVPLPADRRPCRGTRKSGTDLQP